MISRSKDFWSGLLFMGIGLGAWLLARDYPMGSATRMGPAYFPSVLGGLLAAIGVVVVTRAFLTPGARVVGFALKPLVLVTASTVLFGMIVRPAGLAPALMLLVLASAWASRHFSWRATVLLAVGLTAFSVLVFVKALGLPMLVFGPWFGG